MENASDELPWTAFTTMMIFEAAKCQAVVSQNNERSSRVFGWARALVRDCLVTGAPCYSTAVYTYERYRFRWWREACLIWGKTMRLSRQTLTWSFNILYYRRVHVWEIQVSLMERGVFDLGAIDEAIEEDPSVKLLHVQRSCGYRWRPSIPIQEIRR